VKFSRYSLLRVGILYGIIRNEKKLSTTEKDKWMGKEEERGRGREKKEREGSERGRGKHFTDCVGRGGVSILPVDGNQHSLLFGPLKRYPSGIPFCRF
jgi:hypothetical protein